MRNFSWICPICGRPVTITAEDISSNTTILDKDNVEGNQLARSTFIVCPNPECKKFTFKVTLGKAGHGINIGYYEKGPIKTWQLIPQSKGKYFPDYIHKQILEDYNEACIIKDLSPKASATLARRCLQGMIRDYWKVKGPSLKDEIDHIKDKVEPLTWDAIEAVRSIGNIGAHMEKDVNLIVDIGPDEAERLIELIEILLKDWYIARHDRESSLKELTELGKEKEEARKTKINTDKE